MRPVTFAEQTVVYGQGQPQYLPLPAHCSQDGIVTTCWELAEEELQEIERNGGRIWLQQHTFNKPLQPQRVSACKPELSQ